MVSWLEKVESNEYLKWADDIMTTEANTKVMYKAPKRIVHGVSTHFRLSRCHATLLRVRNLSSLCSSSAMGATCLKSFVPCHISQSIVMPNIALAYCFFFRSSFGSARQCLASFLFLILTQVTLENLSNFSRMTCLIANLRIIA